jgi:hypothetical protein
MPANLGQQLFPKLLITVIYLDINPYKEGRESYQRVKQSTSAKMKNLGTVEVNEK